MSTFQNNAFLKIHQKTLEIHDHSVPKTLGFPDFFGQNPENACFLKRALFGNWQMFDPRGREGGR